MTTTFFLLFRVLSLSLSLSLSTPTSKPFTTERQPPQNLIKNQKPKGAMRGVNVVAMEELSEEAISAARSRRMSER